jgi:hypothetical protein
MVTRRLAEAGAGAGRSRHTAVCSDTCGRTFRVRWRRLLPAANGRDRDSCQEQSSADGLDGGRDLALRYPSRLQSCDWDQQGEGRYTAWV